MQTTFSKISRTSTKNKVPFWEILRYISLHKVEFVFATVDTSQLPQRDLPYRNVSCDGRGTNASCGRSTFCAGTLPTLCAALHGNFIV